jgi:hypothetical protein
MSAYSRYVEHARNYTKRNIVVDESAGITTEQIKDAIQKGDQVLMSKQDLPGCSGDPRCPGPAFVITTDMSTIPQLLRKYQVSPMSQRGD